MAADTGGFLVTGTNESDPRSAGIDQDMRFHYLLTYAPSNDALDGKFRTIAVKVRRPDALVFARKGYRAVSVPTGVPVVGTGACAGPARCFPAAECLSHAGFGIRVSRARSAWPDARGGSRDDRPLEVPTSTRSDPHTAPRQPSSYTSGTGQGGSFRS